jgi:hypothetical protein
MHEYGENISEGLAGGIVSGYTQVQSAMEGVAATIGSTLVSKLDAMKGVGTAITDKIAEGINAGKSNVLSSLNNLFTSTSRSSGGGGSSKSGGSDNTTTALIREALTAGGAVSVSAAGGWDAWDKMVAKSVKGLATGGIITKPTFALIGEGGQDEAVAPITDLLPMITSALRGVIQTVTPNQSSIVNKSQEIHNHIYIENTGTIVGRNGMEEFANIISKKLGGNYALSVGGDL